MTKRDVTITITGPFDGTAIGSIIALIRHIEGRNPSGQYGIIIHDPDSVVEDAESVMRAALTPQPGRITRIEVHRKQ